MHITHTSISGVQLVTTTTARDNRGAFFRAFCATELAEPLAGRLICQINISHTTTAGAIRGLHFQHPPHAEMKLVRCIKGRVWDVVVDLRAGSPTLGQWYAAELNADNSSMLIIPEGCAHGFQTLDPDCEMLYLHTAPYNPASEGRLRYNDPTLKISWPLAVTDISDADANCPLLAPDFTGTVL